MYLSVILDAYSRRIVGWSMADSLRSELVSDALQMALHNHRPPTGLAHHSDRGSQYTSYAFSKRIRDAGLVPSMGKRGDAFDNALVESFFATLECELLRIEKFATKSAARMAIFDFIEGLYNPHRRHTSIGGISPVANERRWLRQVEIA